MFQRRFFALAALFAAGCLAVSCGGSGGGGGGKEPTQRVVLLTDTVPSAISGVQYDTQFQATFPNPVGSIYYVAGGLLPAGLTLDTSTGAVTGYPTYAGV